MKSFITLSNDGIEKDLREEIKIAKKVHNIDKKTADLVADAFVDGVLSCINFSKEELDDFIKMTQRVSKDLLQ